MRIILATMLAVCGGLSCAGRKSETPGGGPPTTTFDAATPDVILSDSPTALRSASPEVLALVEDAKQDVLEAAGALGLTRRGAEAWRVEIDPSLPSPFVVSDACRPEVDAPQTTICHVRDSATTVCSLAAIETFIAIRLGDLPIACGGSHREGDAVDTSRLDAALVSLVFVLAHELGHLERGHNAPGGDGSVLVEGRQADRLQRLRLAVQGAPAQLIQEAEADAFASDVVTWLLQRAIRRNAPEHADYVASVHANALASAFVCIDEVTRCQWDDDISLPAQADEVRAHAKRLVCAVVAAPEGLALPVIRGTHEDWATRLAAIQRITAAIKPSADAESSFAAIMDLGQSIDDIFSFWGDHAQEYYKQLAAAIARVTLEFDRRRCIPS